MGFLIAGAIPRDKAEYRRVTERKSENSKNMARSMHYGYAAVRKGRGTPKEIELIDKIRRPRKGRIRNEY